MPLHNSNDVAVTPSNEGKVQVNVFQVTEEDKLRCIYIPLFYFLTFVSRRFYTKEQLEAHPLERAKRNATVDTKMCVVPIS